MNDVEALKGEKEVGRTANAYASLAVRVLPGTYFAALLRLLFLSLFVTERERYMHGASFFLLSTNKVKKKHR